MKFVQRRQCLSRTSSTYCDFQILPFFLGILLVYAVFFAGCTEDTPSKEMTEPSVEVTTEVEGPEQLSQVSQSHRSRDLETGKQAHLRCAAGGELLRFETPEAPGQTEQEHGSEPG